ncbi:MAG: hypothetical protein ACTSWR_11825 [Candidatus Helarchaeota archaeon]
MKFVYWDEDKVKELIDKLAKLEWSKLQENSEKFVAGFTHDGNIIKIYKYPTNKQFKVYYNSLPYFSYINKFNDMERLKSFLHQFNGKKSVEIDDAGIGCPVGGIVICIYSKERDMAALKIIGLRFFQKPLFSSKQYNIEVLKRLQWAFRELNITRDAFIKICPGDIFTTSIDYLWKNGYNIITTKADGIAHILAETRFLQYLESIGIPKNILDVNPRKIDYAAFHKSINDFLRKNPKFKRRFFKTGWYKDKKN